MIDWEGIEESCMNAEGLPDCIPQNIRQWDAFIRQYEKATDLVNGKWEPHYDWNTKEEFNEAINEQFYLGKGYKHSIYECYNDIHCHIRDGILKLLKNIDWEIFQKSFKFTKWDLICVNLINIPRKIGGDFYCVGSHLTSLEGCPKYVGRNFSCYNNMLTSLEGCPKYVGRDFSCYNNMLTSLKHAPEYVGGLFNCANNQLPTTIPVEFPGTDLHKYIDL